VRILAVIARFRLAAWFGMAAMAAPAVLPFVLAVAMASPGCGEVAARSSAIHAEHADHAPAAPHHPTHPHTGCILCQGMHAAGTAMLPGAVALSLPSATAPPNHPDTSAHVPSLGSPAAYLSRAPPSIA
jgi:hypothetical protein